MHPVPAMGPLLRSGAVTSEVWSKGSACSRLPSQAAWIQSNCLGRGQTQARIIGGRAKAIRQSMQMLHISSQHQHLQAQTDASDRSLDRWPQRRSLCKIKRKLVHISLQGCSPTYTIQAMQAYAIEVPMLSVPCKLLVSRRTCRCTDWGVVADQATQNNSIKPGLLRTRSASRSS